MWKRWPAEAVSQCSSFMQDALGRKFSTTVPSSHLFARYWKNLGGSDLERFWLERNKILDRELTVW